MTLYFLLSGALPELPGTETPEDLAEMHAVAYAKRNAERPIENEVVMSEGAVHVTPPVEHVTEVGYSSHADSTATDSGVLTRAEPEGMPSILTREASGDQIGPGSRTTPRNNPVKSTKFGKEFAALYKGEDVREVAWMEPSA